MKKVIIVHHEPLTIKIQRNFYIKHLINKGLQLEYWDISPILFGKINLVDQISEEYSKTLDDTRQFENEVCKNRNNIFITEYAHTLNSLKIDSVFCRYKCVTVELHIHTAINISTKEKLVNLRTYGFNLSTLIKKVLCKFIYFALLSFRNVKKNPDVVFYCGSESKEKCIGRSLSIPINSFDFEDFRSGMNIQNQGGYIVFIDQYYPYHPDMKAYNARSIDPVAYYRNLNILFLKLEKFYKKTVVILAHPKAAYDKNTFNNREIVKYRTAEFVRNADLVLCHDSLAISFGVLNYKPIIFLYTSAFYHMGITTMILIEKFSKMLGMPMVNIDDANDFDIIGQIKVEKNSYDSYKYKYLTSPEAEFKNNEDIISQSLLKYMEYGSCCFSS